MIVGTTESSAACRGWVYSSRPVYSNANRSHATGMTTTPTHSSRAQNSFDPNPSA